MVSSFGQGYTKISARDYAAKRDAWQELKEDWQSPEELLEAREKRKQSQIVQKVFVVKGASAKKPKAKKKGFVGSLLAMVGAPVKTKQSPKTQDPFVPGFLPQSTSVFDQVAQQIANETQARVNDIRELGGQKLSDYYQTLFPEIDKINFDPKSWLSDQVFVNANEDVHRKALAGLFTILDKIFTLRAESHSVNDKQKINSTVSRLNNQEGDRSNLQALVSDALIYLEKIEPFFLQAGSRKELKLNAALAREADHFKKLSAFLKNLQKSLNVLSPKAAKITGANLAEVLDAKLVEKKETLDKLSRTVTEATKRSEILQSANQIAEKELRAKKTALSKATEDLSSKLEEIVGLENQEQEIVERLAEAQGKLSAAEKEAKEKVDAAEETLLLAEQAAKKGTDSQKLQLQTKAQEAQKALESIKAKYEKQVATALQDLNTLKADSEKRVKAIEADLEKAKTELEEKAKVALDLGAANKELNAQIKEIKRAQASTKAIDEAKAAMAKEIEDLKAQLKEMGLALEKAKSQKGARVAFVDPKKAAKAKVVKDIMAALPASLQSASIYEKVEAPNATKFLVIVDEEFDEDNSKTSNDSSLYKAMISSIRGAQRGTQKTVYHSLFPLGEDLDSRQGELMTATDKLIGELDKQIKALQADADNEESPRHFIAKEELPELRRRSAEAKLFKEMPISALLADNSLQALDGSGVKASDLDIEDQIYIAKELITRKIVKDPATLSPVLEQGSSVSGSVHSLRQAHQLMDKVFSSTTLARKVTDLTQYIKARQLQAVLDKMQRKFGYDKERFLNFLSIPFADLVNVEDKTGPDAIKAEIEKFNAEHPNDAFSYVLVSSRATKKAESVVVDEVEAVKAPAPSTASPSKETEAAKPRVSRFASKRKTGTEASQAPARKRPRPARERYKPRNPHLPE